MKLEVLKRNINKFAFADIPIGYECVLFPFHKDRWGYGVLQFRDNKIKQRIGAHRASYMLFNDVELNSDDIIMHTCDNPACINPVHLKRGTHEDNVKDRVIKQRSATGKSNGRYVHGKYIS